MKILLVTSILEPEMGAGTAERTRHLAIHLATLGCECAVIAMAGTTWQSEFKAADVRILLTGYLGRRFPIPLLRFFKIWRLVRWADVVHVMGYWYLLAPIVCILANFARKPFALCPAGELTPEFRGAPWKRFYYQVLGRSMISRAASVIATTARERDEIIRTERVAESRVIISPNGIAPVNNLGSCKITLPIKPFILFVGRLTTIKGPDLLIRAFAQVSSSDPGFQLVMAGPDRGMRGTLQAMIQSLGVQGRVALLGFVDETTRNHLYKNAAFLVIPSRSEVMSMVALEAAALGKPVLLTDRCGFNEVEEVGGGLVVSADVAGLAAGLTKMISATRNGSPMGERLRTFVLTQYAWPRIAGQLKQHLAHLPVLRASSRDKVR
jgi:glycosyltransferase involved in cell wall biosynthesis